MVRTTVFRLGLILVISAGQSAVQPATAQTEGDARQKGLTKAADLFAQLREAEKAKKSEDVKARHAGFVAAVQAVATDAPEVAAEQAAKPKTYQKLTLNAAGAKMDAFRFQAPAGDRNWDLNWEFVYPMDAGAFSWGIVAREGTVDGFKTFARAKNHSEKNSELPKENWRVTQQLAGGKLKPKGEYLIWFAFDGEKPMDVHLRLALTPAR